jgi:hypothetical protein
VTIQLPLVAELAIGSRNALNRVAAQPIFSDHFVSSYFQAFTCSASTGKQTSLFSVSVSFKMKVRRGYRHTRLGDLSGRCSFQAPLIANRLLDNSTLEEAKVVALVQHGGIGGRELAKIVFGEEARSERQLTTLRSSVTARAEQEAGLNSLCIRAIMKRGQFTWVIVPSPETPTLSRHKNRK